jgi:diguanylate cyclase (GGDEF)-like protein
MPATQAGTPSAFHGVDLAEALRLLGQAGIRISAANEASALQQVIDGLCTLSSRDGLTGLANRRVFNDALGREIDRSARTGEFFGLLLLDIDHFKQINDRHGHLVGDFVLTAVARLIEDSFRSIDTVARYGGEEFAVILPNASAAFLQQVAERTRALIEGARIEAARGVRVAVTVSIGTICSLGYVPQNARALIEAADRKLYEAKRLGRNRVCGDPAPAAEVTSDERAQLLRIFDSVDTNS